MLLYDNRLWIGSFFAVRGTVWPNIPGPFLVWSTWVSISYFGLDQFEPEPGVQTQWDAILGVSMSFLLIFRANQAYARYTEGQEIVCSHFTSLRLFVMFSTLYVYGGAATFQPLTRRKHMKISGAEEAVMQQKDERARELRVDLIRLILALATCFKIHARLALEGYIFGSIDAQHKWMLDWERLKLRQLLRDDEFLWVDRTLGIMEDSGFHVVGDTIDNLEEQFKCEDGPYAGPPKEWPDEFEVETDPYTRGATVIVFLLREVLHKNVNDNFNDICPWGIRERYVPKLFNLLMKATLAFDDMDKVITTPLPLPYACLCKTLLLIFAFTFPFTIDYTVGWFGGWFIQLLIAISLLAIDSIATELENPFGPDTNDLDLNELVHTLELECMEFLQFCGDSKGRARFEWRRSPQWSEETYVFPVTKQLVLAELAAEELVPTPRGGYYEGSHRSEEGSQLSGSQGSM